jgi:hypothetical protein
VIDEKYIELIQADVDGELPEQQRPELSRLLLANPEARALRDDLKSLCGVLDQMPREEPPPGLRDGILAAVPASSGPSVPRRSWIAPWSGPAALRYAAMFAGGLFVGGLAFEAIQERHASLDASDVAGTMVSGNPATRSAPVDSVRVALDQVDGTVRLFTSSTLRVVEFDLNFRAPVDIVVIHDGEQARFSGSAPSTGGSAGRYALVLDGPGHPGQPIEVEFVAGGHVIHRDALRAAVQQ